MNSEKSTLGASVRPEDTAIPPDRSKIVLVLREDVGAIPAGTRAFLVPSLKEVLSDYEHGYHCHLLAEAGRMRKAGLDPRWVTLEGRGKLIWTLPKARLRRVA